CHGSLTLFLGTHALAKVWDATAQARAMNSGSRPSGRSACPIGLGTPHYLRPHVPLALIGDHEPDARREGVEGKLSQDIDGHAVGGCQGDKLPDEVGR